MFITVKYQHYTKSVEKILETQGVTVAYKTTRTLVRQSKR